MTSPNKVLFIAGSGRSGSTILSTVLGHLDGFVSIGELTHLWIGILQDRPCGCARSFQDCPFWSRVLEPDLQDRRNVEQVLAAKEELLKQRILWRIDALRGNRPAFDAAADRYASILGDLYRRVQRVTSCGVVVDSSHQPAHGYAITRLPGWEVFVLHIVRDPRAVAFSKKRLKDRLPQGWDTEYMDRFSTTRSARDWMGVNLKAEYFWGARAERGNYFRLRYEDFAAEPRATTAKILRFVDEKPSLDVFADDRIVHLDRPSHHVEGNPIRFQSGDVQIRLDDEWSTAMPRMDRLWVLAHTWPLLLRYGYPKASRRRATRSPAARSAADEAGVTRPD